MIDRLNAALTGRYEIERELGEGGMATVYLAKDLKHNRKVAVKVLKPELAAVVGSERFLTEIETTANLQHPHILPLFDSGEVDGFLFYVMPYIDGETLADRIARDKQLPVDEALGIASSVAGALQVAHEAGVIHRDIKPGNILLSRGQPLVADFGIALAVGGGGARLTETGLSVGTPYYMSPEQATGDQTVGPSADIYALGCVLYEMLVGEPPYIGNTAQAVLGKIIQGVPVSATSVRKSIPLHVDAAIRKALEKLPADRFTRAGDFAGALSDPGFRHGETAAGAAAGSGPAWKRYAWPAAAALAGVAAVAGWLDSGPVEEAHVERYFIEIPAFDAAQAPLWLAGLAPDGSAIAFAGGNDQGTFRMFIKEDSEIDATPVRGLGPEDGGYVAFSPDGQWLAITTYRGDIVKVGRSGGGATVLAEVPGGESLSWLDDGTIVVGAPGKLVRLSESGGIIEDIPFESAGGHVLHVSPLPGGRGFLFTAGSANGAPEGMWVYDGSTGETRMVRPGVSTAWYGDPGLLVMAESRGQLTSSGAAQMTAAHFNLETLEIEGPPVGLTEAVGQLLTFPLMILSRNGTAVYVSAQEAGGGGARLTWLDGEGAEDPVDPTFSFMIQNGGGMRLSPDGSTVAMSIVEQGVTSNVFVKRLPDGPAQQVTFQDGVARRPTWHPDGTKLLYVSSGPEGRDALWETRADGVGSPELVYSEDRAIFEGLWSPDGEWLVYRTDDDGDPARGDILGIRPGVDSVPRPLVATPAEETSPAISPDGRYIAYASTDRADLKQIFVRPFPNVEDGRWQISSGGGTEPAWSPDGSELYFWSGEGTSSMMVARLQTTPQFAIQSVDTLFTTRRSYMANNDHRWYDVSPDGERFLMVGLTGDETNRLVMVRNFWAVAREALGM